LSKIQIIDDTHSINNSHSHQKELQRFIFETIGKGVYKRKVILELRHLIKHFRNFNTQLHIAKKHRIRLENRYIWLYG